MKKQILFAALSVAVAAPVNASQVFTQDVVIQGSECVGFDCVNGESFGSDTIRLKENNLRIHFQDTSNSGSFPTNDWRLIANDSANGGANYFAIEDADAGRIPFRVEAGADANSLYVDSTSRIGFGTATPAVELHVVDGDTPSLRLQQDSSSGWASQTWDIAGNETNFFFRDVTHGSKLFFRAQPGAPENSLTIKSDGKVGIGTWSPGAALELSRNDNTAEFLIKETGSGATHQNLLHLQHNGHPQIKMENTAISEVWAFRTGATGGSSFELTREGTGQVEFLVDGNGDATLRGTLTEGSSREIKENIEPLAGNDILDRLAGLPLSEWSYTGQSQRHAGPMAEDFYATFGLGPDDKHIAPKDLAGVALAAAKALHGQVKAKDAELAELNQRLDSRDAELAELKAQMRELKAMVRGLALGQSPDVVSMAGN